MYAIKVGDEYLDLADNSTISLEINSPFFMTNGIPGTVSYPTNAINTKKNQRILGFPDLLSNQTPIANNIEAQLWVENILYKTGFIKNIKPSKNGYSFTFTSDAGDFQSRVNGVSMQSVDLGTDTLVLSPTNENYALFPVKNIGFYGDKNTDFKGYLNYYHSGSYSTNVSSSGFYSIVPFPYLVYILRELFLYFDYTVTGNWLEDVEINKICVYNNYALDKITTGINVFETAITFSNHVPDMTVGEFLIAVKNMFKIGFEFNPVDKSVEIITINDVIEDQTYVDHTSKASPQYDPEVNEYNGYILKQEQDSSDEQLKEQSDSWVSYKIDNGGEELSTKASTTLTSTHTDAVNPARYWTTPIVNQKGTSTEYDLGVNKFSLRFLIYRGLENDSLASPFPQGSYESDDLSLRWSGATGLYEKYHKLWLDFMEETIPVKREVLLNVVDVLNMSMRKKTMIDYIKFLYAKITIQIPQKGVIKISKTEMYKIKL